MDFDSFLFYDFLITILIILRKNKQKTNISKPRILNKTIKILENRKYVLRDASLNFFHYQRKYHSYHK